MLARVLLVDDDAPFRDRLAKAFAERGCAVDSAKDLSEARNFIKDKLPSHAVVDLRIAAESGLDLIPELQAKGVIVLMLTGYGSVATALEAVRLGAVNYLTKPAGYREIEKALIAPPLTPVAAGSSAGIPSLDAVEWEHIQRVLRDCEGNITHAAKKLGIHRQALQRKLKAKPNPY